MDLFAYAQIEDLEQIAKKNGIEIPRLRGYRLMRDEEPVSQEEINQMKKRCAFEIVEDLCLSVPFWNPNSCCHHCDLHTKNLIKHFLVKGEDEEGQECYADIRWDRIHGKKRKILKFEIKKKQRKIQKQFDIWNKYAGKENVLYIHSRMGGGNWESYEDKASITKQPWFLERVDDWWDGTYCDFYAKIK